ncbi:MAG: histidine kinase [Solirubrobacteraceae bacterium]|jgi:signal transduction histidine kinase
MLLLQSFNARAALALRALGLGLIGWTVIASRPSPGGSGRGLVIAALLAIGALGWIVWAWRAHVRRFGAADLLAMSACGGLLIGASPNAAGSAFAFVAIVTAGFRLDVERAAAVTALAVFTLALGVLVYDRASIEVLAYGLGFIAALLAGANGRQAAGRAEEAELLLAQVQRSREEQLRAARLEESARIAREIHDVLAHTLAGLTIQLEATCALLERGADRAEVLERVRRSHALAREGLEETRRAVGALRGEGLAVPEALEALVGQYRASSPDAHASLALDGDLSLLEGPVALATVRVAQEALTNVAKHAPGATVRVELRIDADPGGATLRIRDSGSTADRTGGDALAGSGGGFGLRGMRERAQILGGSLEAGPDGNGWRVELRLPSGVDERVSAVSAVVPA